MTDDELREWQQLASELEELTQHPAWSTLVTYAHHGDGMLEAQERRVLSGTIKKTDEYHRWTGWIAGARAVLEIPASVAAIRDRESSRKAGS